MKFSSAVDHVMKFGFFTTYFKIIELKKMIL